MYDIIMSSKNAVKEREEERWMTLGNKERKAWVTLSLSLYIN